ncbi:MULTISPECIES: DUF4230 domain-containing protein [unclassified Moraxella]|uniref:DUF4230 domain-containing protein n=1 Tax=unclassified Moraxella TaxID=2685852 RepID=UPI003AF91908
MTNPLPPITPTQHTSSPTPKSPKRPFFWLSLVLFAIICGLITGFWQYQQNHKPKIQTLSRDGVIQKIQTLNRLQTVAYSVDTVIQSHKEGSWQKLWTDEQKGLFVAHGRVQAGIDLNQLTANHVIITGDPNDKDHPTPQTISITLPPAQVFDTYLDNIEVYDIETGMFGMVDIDPQIFAQAQTVGKQQILTTACQANMLKLATDNAQHQIQSLFALANVSVQVHTVAPKACH